jgi:hypothetical protein
MTYIAGYAKLVPALPVEIVVPDSQISLAFKNVITALRAKDVRVHDVMIPVYLSKNITLEDDYTLPTGVSCIKQNQVQRFVIEKTSCTVGGVNEKVYLEGSLDGITWSDITFSDKSAYITLTAAAGTLTKTFDTLYTQYRYRFAKNTSFSFVGSIYLVETSFDPLICLQSLVILFGGLVKATDDANDQKKLQYETDYREVLKKFEYAYDINEDGYLDEDEVMNQKVIRIGL